MSISMRIVSLLASGTLCLLAFGGQSAWAEHSESNESPSWQPYSYEPYPYPYFVEDRDRYPQAPAPAGTVSRHGEIEHIGNGVFGTQWFVRASEPVWHFVTAGDPSNDVVLFVHGYPDTWYAYSIVMRL